MAVTPAGAEVSSAVATNWKKIWKKNLKPLADRRYYKKSASDAKYATKAESAAGDAASNAATDSKLSGYYKKTETYSRTETYSKAEADAKYAAAGSSYSKAESDAKYAPVPALYRGAYMFGGNPSAINQTFYGDISFGASFPSAPTAHYIRVGDPIPAGCSGTASAPNAAAGHLCIFETEAAGAVGTRGVCVASANACGSVGPYGGGLYAKSTGAGVIEIMGSWAARPGGPVLSPAFSAASPGAVNGSKSPDRIASAP